MNLWQIGTSIAFLAATAFAAAESALAYGKIPTCPFCSAVSQTFSEEMGTMDVAVFAKLTRVAETPGEIPDPGEIVRAEFTVIDVLKGKDFVSKGDAFETVYFGDAGKEVLFLVQGIRPPSINWTTPLRLTKRSRLYLEQLGELPEGGAARLEFFQNHLEDPEEMLARDAYDEFARAPYDDVRGLKDKMNHDQLVQWLGDPDIPASRKRLYFTMLGVCGTTADLPMLEDLMKSTDRRRKAGLDAMIACYLTLSGPAGMGTIEDLFLKNKAADYSDTYAAIAALRFHGTEADIISQKRIVQGLGHMLDRPELADLVIPDLARWEDWSVMEQLVKLFKTADEKTSWVRVPVINYLRACPLPEAKQHLTALEKIDPDAVRRASTFFPVLDDEDEEDEDQQSSINAGEKSAKESDQSDKKSSQTNLSTVERIAILPSLALTTSMLTPNSEVNPANQTESSNVMAITEEETRTTPTFSTPGLAPPQKVEVADSAPEKLGRKSLLAQTSAVSPLVLVIAMFVVGACLFAVQWSILTGRVVRFFN